MIQDKTMFNLDLRIDQRNLRLPIHHHDDLNLIAQRLTEIITWKHLDIDKVKQKLKAQFKKYLEQQSISDVIKIKLTQLLDEIPNRTQENEGHYSRKGREHSEKATLASNYLQNLNDPLQYTFQPKPFPETKLNILNQLHCQIQQKTAIKKAIIDNSNFVPTRRQFSTQLSRKPFNYIDSSSLQDTNFNQFKSSNTNEHYNPGFIKRKNYYNQPNKEYQQLIKNNEHKINGRRKSIQNDNRNSTDYQPFRQKDNNFEEVQSSYHTYKTNRNKSSQNLKKNSSQYKKAPYSHRDTQPAGVSSELNYKKYGNENVPLLSRNYDGPAVLHKYSSKQFKYL